MGKAKRIKAVKLFCGFIYRQESAFSSALKIVEKHFGKADIEGGPFPFFYTQYYAPEMGEGLQKRFVSFAKLIDPQNLAKIKLLTNRIESRLSRNNKRIVNLDPGYLNLAKVVLATTKDYSHRIYLGRGIYAEVTLFYENGEFKPNQWAYPDYRSPGYSLFFKKMRQGYAKQIA